MRISVCEYMLKKILAACVDVFFLLVTGPVCKQPLGVQAADH